MAGSQGWPLHLSCLFTGQLNPIIFFYWFVYLFPRDRFASWRSNCKKSALYGHLLGQPKYRHLILLLSTERLGSRVMEGVEIKHVLVFERSFMVLVVLTLLFVLLCNFVKKNKRAHVEKHMIPIHLIRQPLRREVTTTTCFWALLARTRRVQCLIYPLEACSINRKGQQC